MESSIAKWVSRKLGVVGVFFVFLSQLPGNTPKKIAAATVVACVYIAANTLGHIFARKESAPETLRVTVAPSVTNQ